MKFKFQNLILVIILYSFLLAFFASVIPLMLLFIIYTGATIWVARMMIKNTEERRKNDQIEFRTVGAFSSLGILWTTFIHVFYSAKPASFIYLKNIGLKLESKLGVASKGNTTITDVDTDLPEPESREFFRGTMATNERGIEFSILCNASKREQVQTIRCWIFVTGVRDPNKLCWRYALAPFTVPMVLVAYIRRQFDPIAGITSIPNGSFNDIDVEQSGRELEYVAFETLVETLDSFDIDTSDLKQQRANMLNITVQGGKANFGSVVQGAMNKVTGNAKGKTK